MFRILPAQPNLEHLKAQAKDLLVAHGRGDRSAIQRIRGALPSCSDLSDEAIARRTLVLHDAQSVVAREYGAVSWAELSARVRTLRAAPEMDARITLLPAASASLELRSVLAEAQVGRAVSLPFPLLTPSVLPAVPVRNRLVAPGSDSPLQISRKAPMRSVESIARDELPLLAVFLQRTAETETPQLEELHRVGCLCRLLATCPGSGGTLWAVVQGIRWVALELLESTSPRYLVRVSDIELRQSDSEEVVRLDRRLRERTRELARAALPKDVCARALALIDVTDDPERLCDLILPTLDATAAEQAVCAEQTDLVKRQRHLLELVNRELAGY